MHAGEVAFEAFGVIGKAHHRAMGVTRVAAIGAQSVNLHSNLVDVFGIGDVCDGLLDAGSIENRRGGLLATLLGLGADAFAISLSPGFIVMLPLLRILRRHLLPCLRQKDMTLAGLFGGALGHVFQRGIVTLEQSFNLLAVHLGRKCDAGRRAQLLRQLGKHLSKPLGAGGFLLCRRRCARSRSPCYTAAGALAQRFAFAPGIGSGRARRSPVGTGLEADAMLSHLRRGLRLRGGFVRGLLRRGSAYALLQGCGTQTGFGHVGYSISWLVFTATCLGLVLRGKG